MRIGVYGSGKREKEFTWNITYPVDEQRSLDSQSAARTSASRLTFEVAHEWSEGPSDRDVSRILTSLTQSFPLLPTVRSLDIAAPQYYISRRKWDFLQLLSGVSYVTLDGWSAYGFILALADSGLTGEASGSVQRALAQVLLD